MTYYTMPVAKITMAEKKNFVTIKVAADILDSSPSTLRHWDKTGKLPAVRQTNTYRLYKIKDILKFIRDNAKTGKIRVKKLLLG
ncbi:MAG: hypothetical protein UV64_C0019G0002 [Parcubacteria group bacterium GW2011_GWC1_43_11b]|nr:MAG: hypothetical protein UV64_C0019G0002 [Parcubacteria group bacterium GW2011_GWC1_43_11b]